MEASFHSGLVLQKKKNHVCLTQQERTGILTKSKKGDSWKVGTKFSRT